MPQQTVRITDTVSFHNHAPFTLMAGPCAIESEKHVMMMAEKLCHITEKLDIPFIFKSSFDKANRTSMSSDRGIGLDAAIKIFDKVKTTFGCPVITDVHTSEQCHQLADIVDILQIPAFLCRQTDLLVAASKTGKPLNIKKGQFLAPWDMKNVLQKCLDSGNSNIMLCERGASFGYNTLVSDMRSLEIMKQTGHPVVFDATHSVQQPGGQGATSGGQREFVPTLAKAAIAVGVAGLFVETHDDPDNAISDGPNMMYLDHMEDFLSLLKNIDHVVKS